MALDMRNNQKCRTYIKWLRDRLRQDHDPLTWPKIDVFQGDLTWKKVEECPVFIAKNREENK
jgi:hypothetical protein